jgi:hypothetical protein
MNTPLGWARANVLYDKGPMPRHGTIQEAMHLIVWKSRSSLRVAETRAVAQAALGGDSATEAFAEYQKLVNKATVEKEEKSMRDRLDSLRSMQHVKFRPVETSMGGAAKGTTLRTVRRKQ